MSKLQFIIRCNRKTDYQLYNINSKARWSAFPWPYTHLYTYAQVYYVVKNRTRYIYDNQYIFFYEKYRLQLGIGIFSQFKNTCFYFNFKEKFIFINLL